MRIKSNDFRVREGARVDLREWPTRIDPVYATKEEYQDLLHKHVEALSAQQELLYASDRLTTPARRRELLSLRKKLVK
jgi:hypothetical protein